MATVTQTPADVESYEENSSNFLWVKAFEPIVPGNWVYADAANNLEYRAAADTTAATSLVSGLALTPAAAGRFFQLQTGGASDVGGVLAVGVTYGISDTAGGMKPIDETAVGKFPCVLGSATLTGRLEINIQSLGVAKA
jgi:hypothetical protein